MKKIIPFLCILIINTVILYAQEIIFEPHVIDNSFAGPGGIYVADIDMDGNRDVVSAAIDINAVAWWKNNADDPLTWTKQLIDDNFTEKQPFCRFH